MPGGAAAHFEYILSLKDNLSAGLDSAGGGFGRFRAAVAGAGAAVGAFGFAVGGEWEQARDSLIEGTGATGDALESLEQSMVDLGRYGLQNASTAVADLNTHLGLTGPELHAVGEHLLKAKVNGDAFGTTTKQLGLDVDGARGYLDALKGTAQATGVSEDQLLQHTNKLIPRMQAMGGTAEDAAVLVMELAGEHGAQGLRTAVSEVASEIETGGVPQLRALTDIAAENAGAVERNYQEQRSWRDRLTEVKDQLAASLAPYGDVIGAVGSLVSGVALAGPQLVGLASKLNVVKLAQGALNLVMSLNPIGLVIIAIGAIALAYVKWKDQINAFLAKGWNRFIGAVEAGLDVLRPVAKLIGIELPDDLAKYKFAVDEAESSTADIAAEFDGLASQADTTSAVVTDTYTPALETATEKTEAFDLATFDAADKVDLIAGSVGTARPMIESLLKPVEDVTLEFGFFADELEAASKTADVEVGAIIGDLLTIPPSAETVKAQLATIAPTWGQKLHAGLRSTFNSDNVSATLSRAFEGGGGLLGAINSLGAQMGGVLSSSLTEKLGGLGDKLGGLIGGIGGGGGMFGSILGQAGQFASSLLPGIGPIITQGALALGKKIWGGLKRAFGAGKNEAEDAYQSVVEASQHAAAADEELNERMNQALADGLDERAAAVRAFFVQVRTEQGQSWADADAEFQRFHAAQADSASKSEKAWAEATAARLMEDYAALEATTETAAATAEVWAESYTAQTVTSETATDEAIANSERLRDAMVEHSQAILESVEAMAAGTKAAVTDYSEHWAERAESAAARVTSAILGIPDRTVTVTVRTVNASGGAAVGGGVASGGSIADITQAVIENAPRQLRRLGL